MTNMASRSYIGCRRGLEQPQEGAHFWQAFSRVEFEEATPEEKLQGTLMGGWGGLEWSPGLEIPNSFNVVLF